MKKLILSIALLFLFNFSNYSSGLIHKPTKVKQRIVIDNYNNVIDYIKLKEGFSDTIYRCPNGYKTIGYGCRTEYLSDTITFLTEDQANDLLIQKFNEYEKLVKHYYPKLRGNQLLAVTHIAFTLGIGRVHKVMFNGRLNCEKLLEYKYKEVREFEINLYLNKF